MRCVDAAGRERVLFNPAVRRGEPPWGVDMTLAEGEAIRGRFAQPWWSTWRGTRGLAYLLLLSSGLPFLLRAAGIQASYWALLVFILSPFVLMYLMVGAIVFGATRWWGTVAFSDIHENDVVAAMVAERRCPSCAYPLVEVEEPGKLSCTECGGLWRKCPSA